MELFQDLLALSGRICISALFLWAAFAKVWNWKATVEYMQSKKVPVTALLLPAAVLMQILGGVSLLLGYEIRLGAVILIVFMIPAAIKMHDFWNYQGPERIIEKTFFMKDVAVFGGLLLLLAFGGGQFVLH